MRKEFNYTEPMVRPLDVALERGFAASMADGTVTLPEFGNNDVSDQWK